MARAVYSYAANKNTNKVYIQDLYDSNNPTMTVTNDMEQVLSEIKTKHPWINEDTNIRYKDTEGQIDRVKPKFNGNKCVGVRFLAG